MQNIHIDIGITQTVGKFYKKNLGLKGDIELLNATIEKVVAEKKGDSLLIIKPHLSDVDRLIRIESKIRGLLKQELPTSRLKSEVRDNQVNGYIQVTKGQIQTDIKTSDGNLACFSKIEKGSIVDITLCCNAIWSRTDYYPNYLYKWKIKKIFILSNEVI